MEGSPIKKLFETTKNLRKVLNFDQTKILKNTSYLGFAETFSRFLKFIILVYATRILGPYNFGQFSFALAFVSLFTVLSDLGLNTLIVRELKKRGGETDYNDVFTLKTILCLLTLFIITVYSFSTVTNPLSLRIILILTVFMLANSLSDYVFSYFQSKQEMAQESKSRIFQSLVATFLSFAFLYLFQTAISLALAYSLASISSLLYIFIILKKDGQQIIASTNLSKWIKFLRMAWPLAFTGIFVTIYNSIDSVMMGFQGQIYQVGLYGAAYRVANALLIPSFLIYKTFFPALIEKRIKSKFSFRKIVFSYLKVSFYMGIAISVLGIIFAPFVLHYFFGKEYLGATFALQVLVITVFLTLMINPLQQVLIVIDSQTKVFWSTFWGAFSNVSLNLVLIPKYTLNGAALATLISISIVLAINIYYVLKSNQLRI